MLQRVLTLHNTDVFSPGSGASGTVSGYWDVSPGTTRSDIVFRGVGKCSADGLRFAESFVFDGGPPSFLHSNQIADKNLSALSRHFCFLLNPVSNGTGGELDI